MPSVVLSVRTAKSWYDRLQAGDIRGVMNSISKAIDVSEEYGYGVTAWSVDDVLAEADERGIVLTEEDAKNFLAKIEYRIMEDLVDRGWDLIGDLLTAEFGASKD